MRKSKLKQRRLSHIYAEHIDKTSDAASPLQVIIPHQRVDENLPGTSPKGHTYCLVQGASLHNQDESYHQTVKQHMLLYDNQTPQAQGKPPISPISSPREGKYRYRLRLSPGVAVNDEVFVEEEVQRPPRPTTRPTQGQLRPRGSSISSSQTLQI